MTDYKRLQLKEGRKHLTVTNEFQSNKYLWCPAGFLPIKITDPLAMDLLSEYADRRRVIDAEFSRDLNDALIAADLPSHEDRKPVVSQWTDNPPIEPGWYWWKYKLSYTSEPKRYDIGMVRSGYWRHERIESPK